MRKTHLQGVLGKALKLTIEKRWKTVDCDLLSEPFRMRNETDGAWRCEFWGKVIRSCVYGVFFSDDAELRKRVDQTVQAILASQTPDGCISSYPAEKQLSSWDIWGRKYVLLTLMRYYEVLNPDPAVLECCCRVADHLMTQIGPGKRSILDCGEHQGLAASSILTAFVNLWRLTGKAKYHDFAAYIIQEGCSSWGNIYHSVHNGVVPAALGNGKAYEMTSCFQGLAEFLQLEMNDYYLECVRKYYEAVRDREIFVTGVGGTKDTVGEYWYDGAFRQTRSDCGALGETCIITTWIRFCLRMLELTGDATIGDEIEKSLYNGILGALSPDGTHWVHANPTPLTGGGWKACAEDQIKAIFKTPYDGNDCCRAQGPESLALAPMIAVMENEAENSLTVNLFEPLISGNLEICGNYPVDPEVTIHFTASERKCLKLRTPSFLQAVLLNGEKVSFTVGQYLALDRQWSENDELRLVFDFSLQEIPAPGAPNYTAVKRGPLVLAEDCGNSTPDAIIRTEWKGRQLCDYASAGKGMSPENPVTVFFPSCQ